MLFSVTLWVSKGQEVQAQSCVGFSLTYCIATTAGPCVPACNNPRYNQAWNQADLYLLNQLSQIDNLETSKIAIINDLYGALLMATKEHVPENYTDSVISKYWMAKNSDV